MRKEMAAKAALVVVSVAITLGAAEWALRRWVPELTAPPDDWALLSDFYERNADGVFTWPPNREIRYVRLHGDRVGYDVQFHANDLGLVDPVDYAAPNPAERRIALVGDSFTAGYHGGRPWVPELRERLSDGGIMLYSVAIGGAGLQQFEALLASVSRRVSFTDVVLIVISDDLLRPEWVMDVRGDEARFCLESWPSWLCRWRPAYFHRIGLSEDPKVVLARARRSIESRGRSALAALGVQVARARESTEQERDARIAANQAALAAIAREYGGSRLTLIHLPVRGEVERGAYEEHATQLGDTVRALGARYVPALYECRWEPRMFFRNDAHPNRAGYAQVSACVGRALRKLVLPPASSAAAGSAPPG